MQNLNEKVNYSGNKKEILETIIDFASDGILVIDDQHTIIFVNREFEQIFGTPKSKLIGSDFKKKERVLFKNNNITDSVIEHKKPKIFNYVHINEIEMRISTIPLHNANQSIEYVVIMISQRGKEKQYEKRQRKSNKDSNITFTSRDEDMNKIIKICKKIARVDTTVMIYGESGTGKGLLAKYIHQISLRDKKPFIVINCAALPENLLESELFGYTDGAFTGANKSGKIGLIEAADNGTLFLDEIGELSPITQAKLLQVIQDREFIPIGGTKSKKVDIRIIGATNRNLSQMVKRNEFREDLYYRLNIIDIKLPPLRDRKNDIVPLTNYFLEKYNIKFNVKRSFSKRVYQFFSAYTWPGNVRQLENLIEKLVIVSDDVIDMNDIPENLYQQNCNRMQQTIFTSFEKSLEEFEEKLITETYNRFENSRKVAEFLQISQSKASRLIRKYCE
ncbi:sigma-54 interaction domain-containing protein [Pseudalkalibacillus decolorationis]|uniref:sigma-54 interaction domain-containing protein n=1 Tax=Pseudalkalibacillus decolorationis TaxID=163879 RepID=UPI0021483461|nr:sigma 54-interacting transcriptional regulator [Pseudalkalibacillus decolorationis]